MKTVEIKAGSRVKLNVKISSDANVGSNVSLDDNIMKKSITTNFTVDLGLIDTIDGQTLSAVSNFFVKDGAIDAIFESSHVLYTISTDTPITEIKGKKVKISAVLFMGYTVVQLKKK